MKCCCCDSVMVATKWRAIEYPWKLCPYCAHETLMIPREKNEAFHANYQTNRPERVSEKVAEQRPEVVVERLRLLSAYAEDRNMNAALDVGCGPGLFLHLLDTATRRVGLDIDQSQMHNWTDSRVTYMNTTLEDADLKAEYNLVTAWHVLEHVTAPDVFLQDMSDLTLPGGLIGLEIPLRYRHQRNSYDGHKHLFSWSSFLYLLARHQELCPLLIQKPEERPAIIAILEKEPQR